MSLITNKAFSSFADILSYRAKMQPNSLAFAFMEGNEFKKVTYQEVEMRVRQIAFRLLDEVVPGDRVLILQQPGLEYIYSFFACQYAKVVAVPAYPPLSKRYSDRVIQIVKDSGAKVALSSEKWASRIHTFLGSSGMENLINITTDQMSNGDSPLHEWLPGKVSRNDTAFLQYTSGSTGNPKGVIISHQNLLHNSEVIKTAFNTNQDSIGMVWLPPYHDMGLIGGILQPIYTGFPIYLMSPNDFIESPIRWLETISKFHVTTSGGPNFAYELCIRKITDEQLSTLDLSSWKVAFTGAEQVQASILERFAEKFSVCGFKFESFLPCYGLAESTLYVTGGHLDDPSKIVNVDRELLKNGDVVLRDSISPTTLSLVSCGTSYKDQSLLIVDPETSLICEAEQVGEVCIQSDSVAKGYYNKSESMPLFIDENNQVYYKTGDLGFIHNNELYITGRLKELIIVRGQNYYPTDMEFIIESLDQAFVPAGCAAFSILTETSEELVIVQELSRQYRDDNTNHLAQKIREALSNQFGVQAYAICFIKQGSLPKTSSGKIMRSSSRDMYESKQLRIIHNHVEQNNDSLVSENSEDYILTHEKLSGMDEASKKDYINNRIQHLLMQCGVSFVGMDLSSSLISLGLDSLQMITFRSHIEREFNIRLELEALFSEDLSVNELINKVLLSEDTLSNVDILMSETPIFELSDDQKRLWFVESISEMKLHVPVLFEVKGKLNIDLLEDSWTKLLRKHRTLRTVFRQDEANLIQEISNEESMTLNFTHQCVNKENLENLLNQEVGRPFELNNAPLIRLAVFESDPNTYTLQFVAHHIIADLKSMFIVVDDLLRIYCASDQIDHIESSIAFTDYLAWNMDRMKHSDLEKQAQYWKGYLKDAPAVLELPVDYERPTSRSFKGRQHTFTIPLELSNTMRDFSKSHGVTPYMIMFAAFASLIRLYSDQNDFVIGSPMDTRPSPHLARAIGFFAQPMPLRVRIEKSAIFQQVIQQVRNSILTALSNQDISFSKIVELVNPVRSIQYNPIFQVMFSYLKTDVLDYSSDLTIKSKANSEFDTEFDLFLTVTEDTFGELTGNFGYNTDLFALETVSNLSELFIHILREGITNPTQMFQSEFDPVLKKINDKKRTRSNILISSTFTSEMVEESIVYWSKLMKNPVNIRFTPYNQVFQQLLDPQSDLSSNKSGFNVVLIRLSDFLTGRQNTRFSSEEGHKLNKNVEELIQAIDHFSSRTSVPLITCVCPESPEVIALNSDLFAKLETYFTVQISSIKNVHNVDSDQLMNGFEIDSYYDEFADNTGHIPYSYSFFCVMGTAICRKISSLSEPIHKVIILDCDNTLWRGICAEDGPDGVVIDNRSLFLQRFVLKQYEQGMLVCLCSKNNEEDVWNVFDTREEMILKRSHFTANRINWNSKADNLISLASELSLSLESFIFFDDNPVECATVELEIPEVQVIQVDDSLHGPFEKVIERLWLFDRSIITEEDRNRNKMYLENRDRDIFLADLVESDNSYSLEAFLSELQLNIKLEKVTEEHIPRLSQLTFRTNQFNFTGIKRSEDEVRGQLSRDNTRYFAISVQDRFGDYGLVGALFCEVNFDKYNLKNWLLSCRVLGRGVEYKILEALCEKIKEEGLESIVLEFIPTLKNTPALMFIKDISNDSAVNEKSEELQSAELNIEETIALVNRGLKISKSSKVEGTKGRNRPLKNMKVEQELTRRTMELRNMDVLALDIQKSSSINYIERINTEYVAPRNLVEQKVAEIWSELLKIDRISIYDNFFFLGGHSLMSHQIIYRIRDEFQIELPPNIMFSTDFTIASIATVIENILSEQPDEEELAELVRELENLSEEELQELLNESLSND